MSRKGNQIINCLTGTNAENLFGEADKKDEIDELHYRILFYELK